MGMSDFKSPYLELRMDVHSAINVIREIKPDHFHADSLLADELAPEGFKISTIIIDVEPKDNIAVPSDLRTVLLERISVGEVTRDNIGFRPLRHYEQKSFGPGVDSKTILRVIRVKISIKLIWRREGRFKDHGGGSKRA